ncbi:hypothetical protein OSTOST_13551, partial [Ostertagia ostertagi]
VYFFTDSEDENLKARLGDHLTETLCSTGHDSWSCHFDDDNYVNIGRLKTLLFSMNSTLPWYVGKSSTLRPLEISSADGMKLLRSNGTVTWSPMDKNSTRQTKMERFRFANMEECLKTNRVK